VLERYSSYDSRKSRHRNTRESSKHRLNYFLQRIHKVDKCECRPEVTYLLLNGFKSNLDPSTATQCVGLGEFRSYFKVRSTSDAILIIQPSADGFTSNLEGFDNFFRPFENLDITIATIGDKTSGFVKILDILGVIRSVGVGDKLPDTQAGWLADAMVKASLNKALLVSKCGFLS
jgi:hypothetical protein